MLIIAIIVFIRRNKKDVTINPITLSGSEIKDFDTAEGRLNEVEENPEDKEEPIEFTPQ